MPKTIFNYSVDWSFDARQPLAETFLLNTNTAIDDLPLFPASNQFPNQSETQMTQSNLIYCCLSATQP
ncbi:MAG: hypothetical protein LBG58_10420 [Planctomycetaceae bacterium]|nr:hypothetical protein [Planctomycetaceae bacterium]